MIYTSKNMLSEINSVNRMHNGNYTILPAFVYDKFLAEPISWSNHYVALQELQPFGVVQGLRKGYVNDVLFLLYPKVYTHIPLDLVKAIAKLKNKYIQQKILNEDHYYNITVEHFEKHAFNNNTTLKKLFPSWDIARKQLLDYANTFNLDIDYNFPLSSDDIDINKFISYKQLATALGVTL